MTLFFLGYEDAELYTEINDLPETGALTFRCNDELREYINALRILKNRVEEIENQCK